jgi:hypothetical protein
MGTPGQEYLIPETGTFVEEDNLLVGTTANISLRANQAFLLSDGKFVKSTAGTLPAGKAYLPATVVPATAREFTVVFDDMATDITTVKEDGLDRAVIYDLNGQRVTTPGKGIYIVYGKKMVIK